MAPTRLTARLLGRVAQAGAKVIAIGDSGQLPSVLAGGWLRAVGERVGALDLTEVMRQRDPGERRALEALHEGLPDLYVEWAAANGRIDVVRGDRIAEQAFGEWITAAAEHAPGQAVMIARDNDTRARLNVLARGHRSEAGELGAERSYGRTHDRGHSSGSTSSTPGRATSRRAGASMRRDSHVSKSRDAGPGACAIRTPSRARSYGTRSRWTTGPWAISLRSVLAYNVSSVTRCRSVPNETALRTFSKSCAATTTSYGASLPTGRSSVDRIG
jgi:AAA domain